jgi:hypothetical protein
VSRHLRVERRLLRLDRVETEVLAHIEHEEAGQQHQNQRQYRDFSAIHPCFSVIDARAHVLGRA